MAEQQERTIRPIITNRKALHDYEIIQKYEAGIALTGAEVKSIRAGKVSMTDAYAVFPNKNDDELYIIGMQVQPYDFGRTETQEPRRKKKLLLKAQELRRLRSQMEEKGLTIVPLALYFSGPFIKLEIGLARGKRQYDKRQTLKEKELKREAQRAKE